MWNYRVIRHRTKGVVWYGLHEVYYRKNGKLWLWAEEPEAVGDTHMELVEGLAMMLKDAINREAPVLKAREMPGAKKTRKAASEKP